MSIAIWSDSTARGYRRRVLEKANLYRFVYKARDELESVWEDENTISFERNVSRPDEDSLARVTSKFVRDQIAWVEQSSKP